MTIQECYQALGGSYSQVKSRLSSDALIKRFIGKFLDDGSYAELCRAMEAGQREEAFRAAHTLKGVSGNLSLDRLYASASKLTELLRPEAAAIPGGAAALMEEVAADYLLTVNTIRAFLEQSL